MNYTKRFVSWAAVSSLPQAKKISLSDQQQSNREHIERHGGELVAELVVPGQSRNIVLFEQACERIQAYAELRKLIEAEAFDVLVCFSRSRLGRRLGLIETLVDLCRQARILIYETDSPPSSLDLDSGYGELLVGAIKSAGAQDEIAKLIERNRIGMLGRVQRGKFYNNIPFGWLKRYDEFGNEIYYVDEIAAAAVRFITEQYLIHGHGTQAIADMLNERGIASPSGKQWARQSVQYILRRPHIYAGYSEINRHSKVGRKFERFPGTFPAIITEVDAEAIDKERVRRIKARRSVNSPHRFSQVVWCEVCGIRMRASKNYSAHTLSNGERKRYYKISYRCPNYHPGGNIAENKVMQAVHDAIEYLQDEIVRERLAEDTVDQSGAILDRIAEAEDRLEIATASMQRADDEYTDGVMPRDRYRRQVERLTERIEGIKADIADLRKQLDATQHSKGRRQRIDDAAVYGFEMLHHESITTANAWLRRHVRVIAQASEVQKIWWI